MKKAATLRFRSLSLIATGIVCSVASLFTFAWGWDRVGSMPALATALLVGGVSFAIGSLLLFAIGWDARNALLGSGSISGSLIKPSLSFEVLDDIEVTLTSQDRQTIRTTRPASNDTFSINDVGDGVWHLQVTSSWYQVFRKEIRISRREIVDVGGVELKFSVNKVWNRQILASPILEWLVPHEPIISQIMDYGCDSKGREWAVGFTTKDHQNKRSILVKENDGEWQDRVIPQFASAERGTFVRALVNGTVVIGSLGSGAVFSKDGVVLRSFRLPGEIDAVTDLVQLPDGSLLAGGWVWNQGNAMIACVLKFSDVDGDGRITHTVSDGHVKEIFVTASGRVVLGTSAKNPRILFSDDYGETWSGAQTKPEISKTEYGGMGWLNGFFETRHNTILACLNTFNSGKVLLSENGGVSWEFVEMVDELGQISGFAANEECCLCFAGGAGLTKPSIVFTSLNFGRGWKEFMQLSLLSYSSGFTRHGSLISVFGSNGISTADARDLTPTRFRKA